jgi:hypothetical protein
MATLVAVLIFAAPFTVLAALVTLIERREQRRQAEVLRQIALTDALHARLGALVAPVVRRRHHRWYVAVAVPFERPAVVTAVLGTVQEMFERVSYEVVLSRQASATPLPHAPRPAAVGRESLSWT